MAFGKKNDPISSGPIDPPGDPRDSEIEHVGPSDIAVLPGSIATPVKQGAKRQHKATYARDRRNGGYLVRVIGPHANSFGGKIVPVLKRDDSESEEALEVVVWSGVDTGTAQNPGTGKPVALYTFTQKPRGSDDIEF